MKLSSMPTAAADALVLWLLLPQAAAMFRCNHVVADSQQYDLSALDGAHSVVISRDEGASFKNITYTVDICRPLKKKGDVPKEQQCHNGSRVCAITRDIGKGEGNKGDIIEKVVPIAGDLADYGGKSLDPEITRLTPEDLPGDDSQGGLRLVLKGGFDDKTKSGKKRDQKVIITFLCDPDREGTEGEYDAEDKYDDGDGPLGEEAAMLLGRRQSPLLYRAEDGEKRDGEGEGDGEKPVGEIQLGEGKNASLVYESYGPSDENADVDILRLTWRTKYACEGRADEGGEGPSDAHWGFFTWLVILVFLGTAAYLIFGSWLNYNRYGARGWDLVPHGDTIRDVPYLLKDWARRVLNTVQGSGSRGGYSAV
ncbi:hypothetical protein DL768_006170 [Monosporascus sp. mg162]|nr:hypothetical protein DL768_006170 [Monosporascus sp. mg162]